MIGRKRRDPSFCFMPIGNGFTPCPSRQIAAKASKNKDDLGRAADRTWLAPSAFSILGFTSKGTDLGGSASLAMLIQGA
jgi:hypothetical protein